MMNQIFATILTSNYLFAGPLTPGSRMPMSPQDPTTQLNTFKTYVSLIADTTPGSKIDCCSYYVWFISFLLYNCFLLWRFGLVVAYRIRSLEVLDSGPVRGLMGHCVFAVGREFTHDCSRSTQPSHLSIDRQKTRSSPALGHQMVLRADN